MSNLEIIYDYASDYTVKCLLNDVHPENEGKCVVLADEFNWQSDPQVRKYFIKLFNEKKTINGEFDFSKNLLFSVVCVTPGFPENIEYPNYLSDDETSEFEYCITFNSTKEDAIKFFDKEYECKLIKLNIIPENSALSKKYNGYFGPAPQERIFSEKDIKYLLKCYRIWEFSHIILENELFEEFDDVCSDEKPLTCRSIKNLIEFYINFSFENEWDNNKFVQES